MRALRFAFLLAADLQAQTPFLVKPYLQLGARPRPGCVDVSWQTGDQDAAWTVDVKGPRGWKAQGVASYRRVGVEGLAAHRVYGVTLTGLETARPFPYRVRRGAEVVFEAKGQALKGRGARLRAVVMGDIAQGTDEQRTMARRAAAEHPDLVLVPGDIVYAKGRASEYQHHFFPVYNADEAANGAPLLRAVPFVAAVGNHDVPARDINQWKDGLAYFYYWSQPLNGPDPALAAPPLEPAGAGPILEASGPRFPRMANFSFEAGPVHWTVLDSNPYADWRRPELRAWLRADLKASKAPWRFVMFHHPGFSASVSHFEDQWMRLLSPIFEEAGVRVVFAGHVHNYQRSKPLRFRPAPDAAAGVWERRGAVPGAFDLDEAFDGRRRTRAKGIVYVVSGAGGAGLYDEEQGGDRAHWRPWTAAFVSDRHSLTLLDLDARRLVLRQLDAEGRELDRMVLDH